MKAIDLLRGALEMTEQGAMAMLDGMSDAAMTRPTSRGGNHPLWIMGHLAYIEGTIRQYLLGKPNPVQHWASLFAPGSEPQDDPGMYPPFEEVVQTFRNLRADTLRLLDEVGETGLDRRPVEIPPGFEEAMATVGQTPLLTALHQMVHYGQIADARRVAGRKPLM